MSSNDAWYQEKASSGLQYPACLPRWLPFLPHLSQVAVPTPGQSVLLCVPVFCGNPSYPHIPSTVLSPDSRILAENVIISVSSKMLWNRLLINEPTKLASFSFVKSEKLLLLIFSSSFSCSSSLCSSSSPSSSYPCHRGRRQLLKLKRVNSIAKRKCTNVFQSIWSSYPWYSHQWFETYSVPVIKMAPEGAIEIFFLDIFVGRRIQVWLDHMFKYSQIAYELGKFGNYRYNQNVPQMRSACHLYSPFSVSDQVQQRQTFSRKCSLWLMARGQTCAAILMSKCDFSVYLYCFIWKSVNEMTQMSRAAAPSHLHFINLMGFLFAWYYLITSFKDTLTYHSPLSIIHSIEGNHETSTPFQKIHPASGSLWEGDDGKLTLQAQLGGLTESLALALFPFKPIF